MKTLLDYFAPYNEKIFPMQVITLIVAIVLVSLVFILPGATTTLLMRLYLSFTFGWIGLAYLFMMGDMRKTLPFTAIATGITCLAVAISFLVDVFSTKKVYEFPPAYRQLYPSLLLIVWGWILYPLSDLLVGHRYPRAPLYGVVLCPTTIFTIGFLTAVVSNQPEMITLVMLSVMAVAAAARAAIKGYDGEGVYEDFAFLASGILWSGKVADVALDTSLPTYRYEEQKS
jgi:hypothetical protein